MTSRDFIRAESANTDRIILYREGLFWKAYERSAFAVCSQIRSFKPTRRVLKALGGGDLISIGFPSASEERILAGLTRLETSPQRLVVEAPGPIVVAEFEAWKSSVPLANPSEGSAAVRHDDSPLRRPEQRGAAGTAASDRPAAVQDRGCAAAVQGSAGVAAVRAEECRAGYPAAGPQGGPDSALTKSCEVAERIREFDLASSTPVECMMLLLELKRILLTDDHGPVR